MMERRGFLVALGALAAAWFGKAPRTLVTDLTTLRSAYVPTSTLEYRGTETGDDGAVWLTYRFTPDEAAVYIYPSADA